MDGALSAGGTELEVFKEGQALKERHNGASISPVTFIAFISVSPTCCALTGLHFSGLLTQGGAARLSPLALPWADMLRPFSKHGAMKKASCLERECVKENV